MERTREEREPRCEPDSWRTTTRKSGHHLWNSLTHWCITVVGQTMRTGPKRRPPLTLRWLKLIEARKAMIWTVLPRPISSPRIPPTFCWCSSHSHCTHTFW